MLPFPQKGSFTVSTEGAENTHSQAVNAPWCPSYLAATAFPIATTYPSAANSRDNHQFCPCAGPAHDTCRPQVPSAVRPLSSPPVGSLSALLLTPWFRHPNNVLVSCLNFIFPWHTLFGDVYYCQLQWTWLFYILDCDGLWCDCLQLQRKATSLSELKGEKINMLT